MKRLLLLTLAALLLPSVAFAQWDFEAVFPPDTLTTDGNGLHGVAVDPDGKVWLQTFGATDSVDVGGEFQPARVLHVFNPDGTEADFSPVKFLDYPDDTPRDTLGGFTNADGTWEGRSGRGLTTDADGNIIASQFDTLFKIDYQTGGGIARVNASQDFGGPLDARGITEAAVDNSNNVFVSGVFPGDPIAIYDADLNFVANAIDVTVGFSRGFEVSPDGNSIYWAGYTNAGVVLYERPDEFSAYDSVGVVIPGVRSESMDFNPVTGNLWVSAGSPNDNPNEVEEFETDWLSNTWYEFDPATLEVNTVPPFMNLITWADCVNFTDNVCQDTEGRPRGIAFSPDGMTAYPVQFSQAGAAHEYTEAPFVSVERNSDEVPTSISLAQNYPNPFNPTTNIEFGVENPSHVTLKVYDTLGREVAVLVDRPMAAGTYTADFDATQLASGTYLYVLESSGQRLTKTMLLVK
jgi:hypothetical protein